MRRNSANNTSGGLFASMIGAKGSYNSESYNDSYTSNCKEVLDQLKVTRENYEQCLEEHKKLDTSLGKQCKHFSEFYKDYLNLSHSVCSNSDMKFMGDSNNGDGNNDSVDL